MKRLSLPRERFQHSLNVVAPLFESKYVCFAIAFAVILVTSCDQQDYSKPIERDPREVQFITTPQKVVDRMLELCKPTKDDYILDLGCGDGRIIITAAKKYGCKGLGYDIDENLIKICNETAKRQGVDHLVKFVQKDIYKVELPTDATIVALYLYPEMNLRLMPYLQSLKDGVRVVSHRWEMPGVKELKLENVNTNDKLMPKTSIYFFKTPMLVDPEWKPRIRSAEEADYELIKDVLKYAPKKSEKSDAK